jgi:hypothetical protein
VTFRGLLIALVVILMLWAVLTSKMYETEREMRLACIASGGVWEPPNISPINLVEGECK